MYAKSMQNARKICFWRDSQYSIKREKSSSLNTLIPMTLAQKREKVESSGQTCTKTDIELGFAATVEA